MPAWSDRNRTSYRRFLTHNGVTRSLSDWARFTGLTVGTLKHRLRIGTPLAVALSQPPRVIHRDPIRSKQIQSAREKERIHAVRQYKERRPCVDCAGRFPAEVMDFDHVRGVKLFELSEAAGRSLEIIAREIAKCDLVCANCHRLRTASRRKFSGVGI